MRNEKTHFSIPRLANLRMNKKGDIAVTMMVGVALILMIISVSIFINFKAKFENISGLSEMGTEAEFAERYIISEAGLIGKDAILDRNEYCQGEGDLLYKFKCNGGLRERHISLAGNFFAKLENYEFSFVKNDDGSYTFSVKGIRLKSERGASSIERNFDLEMKFDSLGGILEVKRTQAEKI